MPLVTITTIPEWSPRFSDGTVSPLGRVVRNLMQALPEMLSGKASLMKLTFPPDVVQVKHEFFSDADVNNPDVWIFVHLGEEMADESVADAKSVIDDAIRIWALGQECSLPWFHKDGPSIVIEVEPGCLHGSWYVGRLEAANW